VTSLPAEAADLADRESLDSGFAERGFTSSILKGLRITSIFFMRSPPAIPDKGAPPRRPEGHRGGGGLMI
jgi:hypothetical protein